MALSNDDVILRIDNITVKPAVTEGPRNVFSPVPFTLTRAEWVPDGEASSCVLCKERFTQVRRRHHCRVCGNVFCAKCCSEKTILPQYGEEEPSRVCNSCLPVSNMIAKARSVQMAPRLEAAKFLANTCGQQDLLKKLVESGGVQAIIHLAQTNIADVKDAVADGLNNLALHVPLHPMIVEAGGIKAICSILSSSPDSHSQAVVKALSTLKLLSKSEKLKVLVGAEGSLTPLMALCMSSDNTIVILSLTTLGIVLESPVNVSLFNQNFKNGLQTMLQLTKSNDEKIQEVVLRVLSLLACGSTEEKKRLVDEDNYCGRCIQKALKRGPKNLEIYTNGTCLIANLAVCADLQSSLMDCIEVVCNLIISHFKNSSIQLQVSRAVANFSKHKENARLLVPYVPNITNFHVNSKEIDIKANGLRAVFYLVEYLPEQTISALIKNNGAVGLLRSLLQFPDTIGMMRESLLKHSPEIGKPFS